MTIIEYSPITTVNFQCFGFFRIGKTGYNNRSKNILLFTIVGWNAPPLFKQVAEKRTRLFPRDRMPFFLTSPWQNYKTGKWITALFYHVLWRADSVWKKRSSICDGSPYIIFETIIINLKFKRDLIKIFSNIKILIEIFE